MWVETDNLSTIGRELEEAGGVALQNGADRQIWLIEGYLVTVVPHPCFGNAAPKIPDSKREHKRLKAWLTNVGLALIIIAFSVLFIGTLIFMASTNR